MASRLLGGDFVGGKMTVNPLASNHLTTELSHHQLCQFFQSYSLVVSRLLGGDFVGGKMVWCLSTIHSSVRLRKTVLIFCALSLQCFFQGERGVF